MYIYVYMYMQRHITLVASDRGRRRLLPAGTGGSQWGPSSAPSDALTWSAAVNWAGCSRFAPRFARRFFFAIRPLTWALGSSL